MQKALPSPGLTYLDERDHGQHGGLCVKFLDTLFYRGHAFYNIVMPHSRSTGFRFCFLKIQVSFENNYKRGKSSKGNSEPGYLFTT